MPGIYTVSARLLHSCSVTARSWGYRPTSFKALKNSRTDFQREAVRHEADIRIAEMELATLLQVKPADLEQVKTKLQEIERSRLDLRFARIRTIEQGKARLSPEQWAKFQILIGESPYSHWGNRVAGARRRHNPNKKTYAQTYCSRLPVVKLTGSK